MFSSISISYMICYSTSNVSTVTFISAMYGLVVGSQISWVQEGPVTFIAFRKVLIHYKIKLILICIFVLAIFVEGLQGTFM